MSAQTNEPVELGPWVQHAACLGMDTDQFYGDRIAIKRAKAVCDGCPVRQACLDYAVASNIEYGVWGGKSAAELRRLRRSQTTTPSPGARNRKSWYHDELQQAARNRRQRKLATSDAVALKHGVRL